MNVVAGHRTSHTHHMTLLRVGSRWALARLVGLADTDDDTDREFLGAWRRLVLRDKTTGLSLTAPSLSLCHSPSSILILLPPLLDTLTQSLLHGEIFRAISTTWRWRCSAESAMR